MASTGQKWVVVRATK